MARRQESGREMEERGQRGLEGVETRRPEQVAEGGRNVWAYICCWGEVRSYVRDADKTYIGGVGSLEIQILQTDKLNYSKRKKPSSLNSPPS